MKLLLVRHLWGADLSAGLPAAATTWRATGYEALEASIRHVPDAAAFRALLRAGGWGWIAGAYTDMFRTGGTVSEHLDSLREQIEECVDDAPLLINSHSGLDRWSLREMEDFFGGAASAHPGRRRPCSLASPS